MVLAVEDFSYRYCFGRPRTVSISAKVPEIAGKMSNIPCSQSTGTIGQKQPGQEGETLYPQIGITAGFTAILNFFMQLICFK
jgi:hypothetical protein